MYRLQMVRFENVELSQQLEAARQENEFKEENPTEDDPDTNPEEDDPDTTNTGCVYYAFISVILINLHGKC